MIRQSRAATTSFTVLMTLAFLLAVCVGDAFAFQRNTTLSGPANSVNRNVSVQNTGNGYTRSATTTGPNNNSANVQNSGNWNSQTHTWNGETTVTGPGGNSRTFERQTTYSK